MVGFARSQPFYRSQGYIGGKWTKSEREFPVFNPATGEQIGQIPDMGTDNAEHAVGKAHGALKPWRLTTCKLMEYQNQRGGQIKLQSIEKPLKDNWGNGFNAMQSGFTLEQELVKALQNLVEVAKTNNDEQTVDFLEETLIGQELQSIKEYANYLNILKQIESDVLGEFQFDLILLHGHAPDPE